MGSSASKAARTGRRFPTSDVAARMRQTPSAIRPSPSPSPSPSTSSTINTNPSITSEESQANPPPSVSSAHDDDADIGLDARLRQVGPVQPNPTYSNSSTFNQTQAWQQQQQHQAAAAQDARQQQPPGSSASASTSFVPSASAPSQRIFPSPPSSGAQQFERAGPNPAIALLAARAALARAADDEFDAVARVGAAHRGRRFLDVVLVRQVLMMRDELRLDPAEIERRLGLAEGVVKMLGTRGVFGAAEGGVGE
ncbi:MAG: hypothetical protein M1818_002945 [Claussenomyces sp. TS43310]|nr:MAG: hypothetical protein M1818_002945 [Claussenomyces sp. TS43310]